MDHHLGKRRHAARSAAITVLLATTSLTPCSAWAADFIVSNGNDSGAGSLRQAIFDSNAAGGTNNIIVNGGVGTAERSAGESTVASKRDACVLPLSPVGRDNA